MAQVNKIKLLFLIPSLQCGGSEKYMWLLCNNINTSSFDVTLVVLNNSNAFYNITNRSIKIIDLHTPRARNAMFKIRRIIQQEEPAIVFSVSNHLNILLAMFRWLFPAKIKFVARETSLVSSNIVHAKYPLLYKQLVKKFYRGFDHIVCQSAAMQKDLVANFNVPEEKTQVIYNPVDRAGNGQFAIGKKAVKFITVARLSKEKGIDRLIKSVSALKIPCQFFIIGDGEERAALEKLAKEQNSTGAIIFTGRKQLPYEGMEDAALFLMGSHYEGFPNVLLEAGALGIPVVAFDVPGGINEIIQPEINGLLVKDNDTAAFTAAIEKALQMQFNREGISAFTYSRFSLEKSVGGLEALFKML